MRRLTTVPPPCADCLEIWEPHPPGALMLCPGLYRNCYNFFLSITIILFLSFLLFNLFLYLYSFILSHSPSFSLLFPLPLLVQYLFVTAVIMNSTPVDSFINRAAVTWSTSKAPVIHWTHICSPCQYHNTATFHPQQHPTSF